MSVDYEGPTDLTGWIASGRGVWVETDPATGGPDPQPPEGEQIGEFGTPEQASLAATAPEALRLLRYLYRYSNAKALLSEAYLRDLEDYVMRAEAPSEETI